MPFAHCVKERKQYMSNHRSFRGSRNRGRNTNSRGRGQRSSFDPSMLVQKATFTPNKTEYSPTNLFSDFDFHQTLHRAIEDKGYTKPTPIQDAAIEHILEGRDLIGLASTGTGKTAAFLLPLIQKVYGTENRVLIIAPTRELAVQIRAELRSFTHSMKIDSALCIGGVPLQRQIKPLKRYPHFVIGTPGRIIDLERRRELRFTDFSTIVLDEVDQMLDMGFINDMKYVISRLPKERHSLFFSATLSPKLDDIVRSFLQDPITVEIEKQTTSSNVDQDVIKIKGQSKVDVLHDLLVQDEFEKVLVFGRTKRGLNKLAKQLVHKGHAVAAIHGNKSQNQRQASLEMFKKNKIKVLLATDIASRGLDICDVSHVINFDLPGTYEDYIHRIGRTGRANKTGKALSFVD